LTQFDGRQNTTGVEMKSVGRVLHYGTGSEFDPLLDEVTERRKSENRKRRGHFAHVGLSWVRICFIDRDSSVGIVTYYGLDGPGIKSR